MPEDLLLLDQQHQRRAAVETVAAGNDGGGGPALFRVDVSKRVGSDFSFAANDLLRMFCIQLAIQALVAVTAPPGTATSTLFVNFLLLLSYIMIGVLFYWAVVRRLVVFV